MEPLTQMIYDASHVFWSILPGQAFAEAAFDNIQDAIDHVKNTPSNKVAIAFAGNMRRRAVLSNEDIQQILELEEMDVNHE